MPNQGATLHRTQQASVPQALARSDTAYARFVAVLRLTATDPNSMLPATIHFHKETIVGIGVEPLDTPGAGLSWSDSSSGILADDVRVGDYGFRDELRDSVHFHEALGGGAVPLHPTSSSQIGHFLTAADIGFYVAGTERNYAEQQREVEEFRKNHPLRGLLRDFLMLDEEHDARMRQDMINTQFKRAMVGHELVADGGVSGLDMVRGTSTLAAPLAASHEDVNNFLHGRLDLIRIDDSKDGNSYQDLLLTWIGYRFGQHMANHRFGPSSEAAWWLEMMLTDGYDLADVARGDDPTWSADGKELQQLLKQFRAIQHRTHGSRGGR